MTERAITSPLISLSLGPPQDIERLGYLQREFDSLAFELALQIIRNGCRVLYGGHLHKGGMTLQILEHIAQAYRSDALMLTKEAKPVINLLAGSELRKAKFTQLTETLLQFQHFIEVRVIINEVQHWRRAYVVRNENQLTLHLTRPDEASITIEGDNELSDFVAEHVTMTDTAALSTMRQAAAEIESARIVAGGRRGDTGVSATEGKCQASDKFRGEMPGIYEEIIASLPTSPVVILAAWGGAAREAAFDLGLLGDTDIRTSYHGPAQAGMTQAREKLQSTWHGLSVEQRGRQCALGKFASRDDAAILARDVVSHLLHAL